MDNVRHMLTTAQVSGGAFGLLVITDDTLQGTWPVMEGVPTAAQPPLQAFLSHPAVERAFICGKVGRTTLCNGGTTASTMVGQVGAARHWGWRGSGGRLRSVARVPREL